MLTARLALQIAASYGFSIRDGKWEKELIRASLLQARGAEGFRSDLHRYKSAEEYFDGYMAGTAYDIRVEGLQAREFERNAY